MPDPSTLDPSALFTSIFSQAPLVAVSAVVMYAGWKLRDSSAKAELAWLRDNFYRGEAK